jgi:beta-fructofuranosidase
MLRLEDDWIWDSWIADDGERYHLFFLKAPRALEDPARRHTAATIGHATSTDLVDWDVDGDALLPDAKRWDDLALWTGSVVRGDDGIWRLFYTALSTAPGHGVRDQRIGMAESDDLSAWRRVGDRPLVAPDPCWYRTLDEDPERSETWRDPFVFRDPDGDGWHMLITARAGHGPVDERGVVGHARSADLLHWEVQPPLSEPGAGFGQLEVFQVEVIDGRVVLLFNCLRGQLASWRNEVGGIWYVVADSPTGPFDISKAMPLTDDSLYVGRLVRDVDDSWVLLAFHNQGSDGFVGSISDPMPVQLTPTGLTLGRA